MIQHIIELTEAGYRLVIWEPAPRTTTRVNPFIFKATYLLSSHSKALEVLNMVKGENGAISSQVNHKAINQQVEQDFSKSPPDRLLVALQA
jgi:hypothetical protein